MTTKQTQKIGKQLLADVPGFIAEGKMVFKPPADDDVLRALFFENTSDANSFHFTVFFMPLFVPTEHVYFNYGKRIGNAVKWRLDNPSLMSDLRGAIQAEALPFLNKVSTLIGVISYLKTDVESDRQHVNPHTLDALACAFVKDKQFPAALKALADQKRLLEKAAILWMVELRNRAQLMEEKILQGPEAALAQLDTWKAQTIRSLALEVNGTRQL